MFASRGSFGVNLLGHVNEKISTGLRPNKESSSTGEIKMEQKPTFVHRCEFLGFLSPAVDAEVVPVATEKPSLVIINSCSPHLSVVVNRLWDRCQYKLCADGGANRLFASLNEAERSRYVPDYVVGDLDSLESSISEFYRCDVVKVPLFSLMCDRMLSIHSSKGCHIVRNPDQDSNDLDKTLVVLKDLLTPAASSDETQPVRIEQEIIIVGAFGGRFDQEMANIHALFRWKDVFARIVLLDTDSVTFLLDERYHHEIYLQREPNIVMEGTVIGLLPIGRPAERVSTTGLQWNLHDHPLSFGQLISSSNRFCENDPTATQINCVTVDTSDDLVWTSSFRLANQ